tara:strand:- start:81 stop:296 length:216 start_codon:yes stop_codon:yes gene_type:complete
MSSKFNAMKPVTYGQLINWLTVVCDDEKKLKQNVIIRESKGDFKKIKFVCRADYAHASNSDVINEGDIFIS